MASATEYLWFETPTEHAFVRITDQVRAIVRRSGVAEGMVLVSAMHITATVYVNDDEPGLISDIERWADRLAPPGDYAHHRTGESNGDAHLKNLLIGHQVLLPVTKGDLDLGPWEQVFYGEFDGRRRKRVVVKVLGDPAPSAGAAGTRGQR
jgi:secondary thiamine-phosphate synthase enzyme